MRLRNMSGLVIPKDVWMALARAMRVDGILPGAKADNHGTYENSKTLRVTVRPRRRVARGIVTTTGSHTFGRITLAPCRHCTFRSFTQVFIHELFHAWIFQYHERLYDTFEHCRVAERFAEMGFLSLGGGVRDVDVCGSYLLDPDDAREHVGCFDVLAESLTQRRKSDVPAWQPGVKRRPVLSKLKANYRTQKFRQFRGEGRD